MWPLDVNAPFQVGDWVSIEWHFRPYLLPAGQFTKCDPPWQLGLIGWQIVPALCGLRTPLDFGLHLRNASPRAPSP